MQVRVARPTRDLERATAFYRLLDLPVIASFEDHAGYSGVVFGLPDASRQLELVAHEGEAPAPTAEDQLVLYLGSAEAVARDLVRRSGRLLADPLAGCPVAETATTGGASASACSRATSTSRTTPSSRARPDVPPG
jgi:catechol 2,3-dioxygenase-like lactoylglutathione lyase family enzyme